LQPKEPGGKGSLFFVLGGERGGYKIGRGWGGGRVWSSGGAGTY